MTLFGPRWTRRAPASLAVAALVVAQGLPATAAVPQAAAAAQAAGREATAAVPRLANWPLRGPLTSPFAPRWGGFHNGLDIAGPFFAPVYAAAPGIVNVVGRPYAAVGDTAMVVSIVHADGLTTLYVHLDDRRLPLVTVGQRVSAGQQIAYVGNTGWSTGPHLHFTTLLNGRAVDPLELLPPP